MAGNNNLNKLVQSAISKQSSTPSASTNKNTSSTVSGSSQKTTTNNNLFVSTKDEVRQINTTPNTTNTTTKKPSLLSKINENAKKEADMTFTDSTANNQKDSGWAKNMFAGSVKQRWSDYVAALANQNETNAYADKSNLALGLALTHDKDSKASANELTHSRITENEKIYDYAYDVRNEGQENTQKAKNALGNSTLGNIVTDLSTVAVQVGGDALASALLGPEAAKASMAASVYGSSILTSKENGANLAQQTLNATANAGITYGLEALLGGLTKTYGSKLADKVIDKLVKKIPTTENGKMALTKFLIGLSESAEEMLEDIGQKMTERIYTNQGLIETLEDEDLRAEFLSNMLYDGLIGGLMGEIGAGVEIASDLNAKAKVEADARAQTSQNIDNVVDAMSMYDDAIINNIKNTQQGPSMENMDLNPDTNPSVQGPIQERQGPTTNFKPETNADVQGPVPNFNPETNPDAYGPYLNGEPDFRPETNPYIQGPTVNPTQGPTLPSTNSYNTLTEVIVANGKNYSKMASTIYSNPKLRTQFYQEFGKPNGISNTQIINDMAKTLSKRAPIIQKSGSLQMKYGEKIAPDLNSPNVEAQKLVANGITYSQLTKLLNNGEYEVINRIANLVGAKIDYDMSNGKIKDAIMERANDPNVKAMAQQMYNQNVDTQRGEGISRMDTLPTEQPTQPFGLRMSNHKDPNVKPQQELRNNPLNTKPKKDTSKPQKTKENPLKPTQKVQETKADVTPSKVENTSKVETATEKVTTETVETQKTTKPKSEPKYVKADEKVAEAIVENSKTKGPDTKEAGFSENVRTDKSMEEKIRKDIKDDPTIYEVAHNNATLEKAVDIIKEKGYDGATEYIQNKLNEAKYNNKKIAPEDVPLARLVANELSRNGQNSIAHEILSDLSLELAYNGQIGQAAIILRNTDPIVAKKSINKWIKKINDRFKKFNKNSDWEAKLTDAEIEKINSIQDWGEEGVYDSIISELQDRFRREMPSTFWQKMTAMRKLLMLGHTRTGVKNFAANIPTVGIEFSDRNLDALLQGLVASNVTLTEAETPKLVDGKFVATVKDGLTGDMVGVSAPTLKSAIALAKNVKSGRTKALYGLINSDARNLAHDVFYSDEVQNEITNASDKFDAKSGIIHDQTIFKGTEAEKKFNQKLNTKLNEGLDTVQEKISNIDNDKVRTFLEQRLKDAGISDGIQLEDSVVENLQRGVYWLMGQEDLPFVRNAYINSLASNIAAKGITDISQVTDTMKAQALADAEYYTYKSANAIARELNKIKQNSLVGGAVLDVLLPFTTTPANILQMTWDHTIGGAVKVGHKAAKLTIEKAKGNKISAEMMQDFTKTLSQSMTGTAIVALGAMLRSIGAITGSEDDNDKKAAFDKATGNSPYSLWGIVSYDWAEPAGSYLAMGADMCDILTGNGSIGDMLYGAGDAFMNMGSMTGARKILRNNGKSTTQNVFEAIAENFMSQLTGGISKDIGAILDDKSRSTYDASLPWSARLWNQMKYNLGFRKGLAESVDVLGNGQNKTTGQRIADTLFIPANVNRKTGTDVTKFVYDMYDKTGSKTIFPDLAPYSVEIDGTSYPLTAEEHTQWQKTSSKYYIELVNEMKKSGAFDGLDDKGITTMFSKIRETAKQMAQSEFTNGRGIEYDNATSKLLKGVKNDKGEDYIALKPSNLTSYLTARTLLNYAIDDDIRKMDSSDAQIIDKVIKSMDKWDDNLTTVFSQRNSDYKMYAEAAEVGVKANSVIQYKTQLDKIQRNNKSDSDNGRFKFDALMDADMSETDRRNLADVVLNKTQVKVIEALEAGGDYNLADANNFWESIATVEVIDKDGNMSVESLTNISKATFRDALLYYYPNNSDARNKIWDFYYNQPEEHTASGYSTDYEVGPQYKNDKTKVTVDGKEMTRGVDYEMKKNTYGTWVVRFKEPVPKGCVIKIDDGVTPTINDRSLKYYTFDYFSKNTYDANSSKFHEVGETANPTGKKQNTSLNNLIQNYLIK